MTTILAQSRSQKQEVFKSLPLAGELREIRPKVHPGHGETYLKISGAPNNEIKLQYRSKSPARKKPDPQTAEERRVRERCRLGAEREWIDRILSQMAGDVVNLLTPVKVIRPEGCTDVEFRMIESAFWKNEREPFEFPVPIPHSVIEVPKWDKSADKWVTRPKFVVDYLDPYGKVVFCTQVYTRQALQDAREQVLARLCPPLDIPLQLQDIGGEVSVDDPAVDYGPPPPSQKPIRQSKGRVLGDDNPKRKFSLKARRTMLAGGAMVDRLCRLESETEIKFSKTLAEKESEIEKRKEWLDRELESYLKSPEIDDGFNPLGKIILEAKTQEIEAAKRRLEIELINAKYLERFRGKALKSGVPHALMLTLTLPGSTLEAMRVLAAYSGWISNLLNQVPRDYRNSHQRGSSEAFWQWTRFDNIVGYEIKDGRILPLKDKSKPYRMLKLPVAPRESRPDLYSFYAWELQNRGALHLHICLGSPSDHISSEELLNLAISMKDRWFELLTRMRYDSEIKRYGKEPGKLPGVDMFERSQKAQLERPGEASWKDNPEKWQWDIQFCNQSVAAYFSKYASKNAQAAQDDIIAENYIPSRWWGCNQLLRDQIKSNSFSYEIVCVPGKNESVQSLLNDAFALGEINIQYSHSFHIHTSDKQYTICNGHTDTYYFTPETFQDVYNVLFQIKGVFRECQRDWSSKNTS